jgi:hypothetical protein
MISTTRRSPNATLVTKNSIDQAAEALQGLPEKTKEKLSLREAVDVLRDHITAALDKGYSYEDIAVMLAKQGVSIAPSSLKHYLARSNRQLRSKTGGTQPRRRRTNSKVAVEAEDLPELAVPEALETALAEVEEAPKRGRAAKTKTAGAPAARSTRTKTAATTPTRKRRSKATS